ncbi:pyrroline-5-carboxylate reductase [Wenzhouxiangella sp. XN24]|uniref:pyrroline-5-carboxylate reductase n=1 Tax=Wenzhouxiangella sp. XN24 TaxID=2713569 RepID=UPI0013EADA27|nr:pyrroline-5-carboxylate reductase [Wenzhouxiangella sp. XN24]NGX16083.1 pyrroline-5-carboxylate reductase [Wenzhouxiangella sp. XN24]
MKDTLIAFIGGGNMTRSIVGGLLADGVPARRLRIAEPDAERRAALQRDFGVAVSADNAATAAGADVVLLAVKPQVLQAVARDLAPALSGTGALAVSIAAGIRSADLARWLGDTVPVVRAMPNTPALLGCGATVLCAGPGANANHRELAESILRAVGSVSWITDEMQMDTVTALSGSGPAYFFLLTEAMADAAAAAGLDPELARLLAVETALGAARMAIESGEDIAVLRRRVTSPGGTTEAAVGTLEQGGLRELVRAALTQAATRSRELAERLGDD